MKIKLKTQSLDDWELNLFESYSTLPIIIGRTMIFGAYNVDFEMTDNIWHQLPEEYKKKIYKYNLKKMIKSMLITVTDITAYSFGFGYNTKLKDSITMEEIYKNFDENKRIIKEKIESTNKLGCYELGLLAILIDISSREDFTVEYIDRIIEECIHNISTIDYLSKYISFAYCGLLLALLKFLSRNGYYSIGEKRCKEVLNYLEKHPLLFNYEHFYFKVIGLLAMIYLRQDKIEGVELANKMLKYKNVEVEIIDDPSIKVMADIDYKILCKVNKTGIDFEF